MKIIATDLDRTLMPNGSHRLSPGAMVLFKKALKKHKIKLVYVTGRYQRLIEDGMKRYHLPEPAYCVGDVGTVVYQYKNSKLVPDKHWQKKLAAEWQQYDRKDIAHMLNGIKSLRQQEAIKLNQFKQSYYVDVKVDKRSLVSKIEAILKREGVKSEIIYSVDVNRNIGLVDILPRGGTKITALRYVLKKMGAKDSSVLYSGDSGNDFLPLTSGYYGVLVKNASAGVKRDLLALAHKKKVVKKVYIAQGNFLGLNGNYVSGIIEGAYNFNFFK